MLNEKLIDDWRNEVQLVLESKRREFELLGYQEISSDDIWRCLVEKVWKNKTSLRLHEVVQGIFHLKVNTYMDYLALNTLHHTSKDELMASINAVIQQEEEIQK